MKLYDACKAAYTNFQANSLLTSSTNCYHSLFCNQQVSLDPGGTDKFSSLLQICHKSLSTLFEVSLMIIRYVRVIAWKNLVSM